MIRHLAHIADHRKIRATGRCGKPRRVKVEPFYSGYGATGDARHKPFLAVVDVGREFTIGEDGILYVPGFLTRGKGFTAATLLLGAKHGLFGMKVVTFL
jgi:hypothetical protein